MSYILGASNNLFALILCSQMIQSGERMEQASPGNTLKQATRGAVAESLLQASLESGLFLFPFA